MDYGVKQRTVLILLDAPPIHSMTYNAGRKQQELKCEDVYKIKEVGVYEPDKTEWASLVVLVPKKDKSMIFCADLRKLDAVAVAVRDTYITTGMDGCIGLLNEVQMCSTLNANSGYS